MREHGIEQYGIAQVLIGQAELNVGCPLFAQQLTRAQVPPPEANRLIEILDAHVEMEAFHARFFWGVAFRAAPHHNVASIRTFVAAQQRAVAPRQRTARMFQ